MTGRFIYKKGFYEILFKLNRTLCAFLAFFLLLSILSSCVKEYWPKLDEGSDNLLVVDAKITNEEGPYTVRLSRSSPVQSPEFIPVTKALVVIFDANGQQEVLSEIEAGFYQTDPLGIRGVIGHSYKISITTNSGETYESEFEVLPEPVGLKSIDYKQENQVVGNTSDIEEPGYQFYLTTDMGSAKDNFYFWEMEETYEYHSAYKVLFYYDGEFVTPDESHPLGLKRTINPDTLFACWKTGNLMERYTYSTQFLSSPIIENYPIHFIPFSDERLQKEYSVLVKQLTVSRGSYSFYKALEEQNANQGGIITSQPYQVRGNVKNIIDPEEGVLGYFTVAGVAYGPRIFVKAPQYYQLKCGFDTLTYNIQRFISKSSPSIWPLYFTYVYFPNPDDPMAEAIEALALVHQDCLDCTKKGGVATKPDFWP